MFESRHALFFIFGLVSFSHHPCFLYPLYFPLIRSAALPAAQAACMDRPRDRLRTYACMATVSQTGRDDITRDRIRHRDLRYAAEQFACFPEDQPEGSPALYSRRCLLCAFGFTAGGK